MKELLKELGAVHDGSGHYTITSGDKTKSWTVDVFENPVNPATGTIWDWKIAGQLLSDKNAADYLRKIIQEKITGIRIINRAKPEIPDICGNGKMCKYENQNYFSMLCMYCHKADQMQAEQDGVILQYQSGGSNNVYC